MSRTTPAPALDELLPHVLARAGIGPTEYDVLIVGDGSGSGWDGPCGWGAVLVDRIHRGRQIFHGGATNSSVNFAEALPYLQALNWYDCNVGKALLRTVSSLRVHILTDSQCIAHWGTRAMQLVGPLPRKHLLTWAALREYRRLGYLCTFHWAPRMTSGLNWAADLLAGLSRDAVRAVDDGPAIASRACQAISAVSFVRADGTNLSCYEINPDD